MAVADEEEVWVVDDNDDVRADVTTSVGDGGSGGGRCELDEDEARMEVA